MKNKDAAFWKQVAKSELNHLSEKHARSNIYDRGLPLNIGEVRTIEELIKQDLVYYDIDESNICKMRSKAAKQTDAMKVEQIKAFNADVKQARKEQKI